MSGCIGNTSAKKLLIFIVMSVTLPFFVLCSFLKKIQQSATDSYLIEPNVLTQLVLSVSTPRVGTEADYIISISTYRELHCSTPAHIKVFLGLRITPPLAWCTAHLYIRWFKMPDPTTEPAMGQKRPPRSAGRRRLDAPEAILSEVFTLHGINKEQWGNI